MMSRVRTYSILVLLAGFVVAALPIKAQAVEKLSLEGIAHPLLKKEYAVLPTVRLEWASDGALIETKIDKGKVSLLAVDPTTGNKTPLLDTEKLLGLLVGAGANQVSAEKTLARSQFQWNKTRTAFLITIEKNLYYVNLRFGRCKRLTTGTDDKDEPSFSPDDTHIAYLKGNDLYLTRIDTAIESRLTDTGSPTLFNGRLNWVYMEELYGRGNVKGYWWSPDGGSIAYLQLDDRELPLHVLVDDRNYQQQQFETRYPKAGDPNPGVRLGLINIQEPLKTSWLSNPYPNEDILIVQVGFDPSGSVLASYQNRTQTWLDLRAFDSVTGMSISIIKESSAAWVDRLSLPLYIKNGSQFIWESERTGYKHLYLYEAKGKLIRALTRGKFDVEFLGLSPDELNIFMTTREENLTGQQGYFLNISSNKKTKITTGRGFHQTRWNADFTLFIDQWSHAEMAPKTLLKKRDGALVRIIAEGSLKSFSMGEVKFQRIKTRDGGSMETMLILPSNRIQGKQYPVFQHIYGGPNAPQVIDRWSNQMLWYHYLAQEGYIVWICDNRSASPDGVQAAHPVWKKMGIQETLDQLDGLTWLSAQGFADMNRIALEGWSYGGYMTSFAMTQSKAWKIGIVGAPVTDWRLYDSIYTERFMGLPSENINGYDASSVLKAAKNLSGKVLILHGTMDDNVHPQNSIMLIDELQKNYIDYEMRLYPGATHGITQTYQRYLTMWNFIKINL